MHYCITPFCFVLSSLLLATIYLPVCIVRTYRELSVWRYNIGDDWLCFPEFLVKQFGQMFSSVYGKNYICCSKSFCISELLLLFLIISIIIRYSLSIMACMFRYICLLMIKSLEYKGFARELQTNCNGWEITYALKLSSLISS